MATIYDVAKEAAVSAAAVSIVLNDPTTSRVGAAKKKHILSVAKKLGYSPSGAAKALSMGRTRIIGLVVPMRDPIFFNQFIAEVLSGIQTSLVEHEYHLMIYSHQSNEGRITQSELMHSRYADGLIVLNTRMCSEQDMLATIDDLRKLEIPFVMMNCYAGDEAINYVGVDDRAISRLGIKYLLSKGHRRIALLAGSLKSPMTQSLLQGVEEAFKDARGKFNRSKDYVTTEYNREVVRNTTRSWIHERHPPTAIFCLDDQLIPDVYATIHAENKRIPEDVAVLGRGNPDIGKDLEPPLTTVSISALQMGRQAADLLLRTLSSPGSPPTRIILSCDLIERGST